MWPEEREEGDGKLLGGWIPRALSALERLLSDFMLKEMESHLSCEDFEQRRDII